MIGDVNMLDAAGRALLIILDPVRFLYLSGAVLLGLCIGILPGIGGLTGFALLMPFTFTMDPYTAFACLLGMASVVNTSDTIPSVLLGVPGTASSQATVLDGLPMTQKGEAGRALAAAYAASLMGGLFGALVMALTIPVIAPLVLAVGTPELFGMTVLAIAMVAALSGSAPLRGMIVGCFGIALAMIGSAPQTGSLRWTQGTLYLWDGLPLLPLLLGLFAMPELCDMAIQRRVQRPGAQQLGSREGMVQGIRDAVKHWFLVIRCASIGTTIGAIPGLSGSVVDWLAYAHARRSLKGAWESFGKGDVRGVIAPESANNATTGGALVPTLAFGVPGSSSMALLLGAFMIQGITPGPDMLSTNLDLTYSMVWSIALANVVGAGVCIAFSAQFAKLALLRYTMILPAVLTVVYIGAFQGSRNWGDLYVLLAFGVLGWIMKRLRWPRPPLILGFVLGLLLERYLGISIVRYGAEWLLRPGVIVLLALSLFVLVGPFLRDLRRGRAGRSLSRRPAFKPADLMYVFFILLFGAMFSQAAGWSLDAAIGPLAVCAAALTFATCGLAGQMFVRRTAESAASEIHLDLLSDHADLEQRTVLARALRFFLWLVAFMAGMALIGVVPTIPLFVVAFLRSETRESWKTCLIYAACLTLFTWALFDLTLHLSWPRTLLGRWYPVLHESIPTM